MRLHLLVAVALIACRKEPEKAAAPAPSAAPDAETSPPPQSTATADENDPRNVLSRWNAAHAARDAKKLEALYADRVRYYEKDLTRAQCVDGKTAGFAAAPDFTQSLGHVIVENGQNDPRDAWVRFVKTVTANGKTKDYPAKLVVRDGKITAEADDTSWCLDPDLLPSTRVIPPFTMSASEAMQLAQRSSHVAEVRKRLPDVMVDTKGFGCARKCVPQARDCGYQMRMSNLADHASSSNLVGWLTVEPETRTLWVEDTSPDGGGKWRPEPLPP